MTDIKTKVQGIDANLQARDIRSISEQCDGNIYRSLIAIHKRARQLAVDIKQELHQKLDEFALSTDTIEEIHENKEQIEISKFYERMPNPTVIALNEFLSGELKVTDKNQEEEEEEDHDDHLMG